MAQYYYSPNELYHYGILGMKWGVRRYQNKDGTLTSAGKKRYQKDADKLASLYGKAVNSEYEYLKSRKHVYTVDERGFNTETGFDASRGIIIHDTKKNKKRLEADKVAMEFETLLKKKFDDVVVEASGDLDSGEQRVKVFLKKNGDTLMSKVINKVEPFEIPVEFVTYKR